MIHDFIIGAFSALVVGLVISFLSFVKGRKNKTRRDKDMGNSAAASSLPVLNSAPPIPSHRIQIGKLHEQGARSSQQDCFGVSDEFLVESHGLLAVVADGMGGLSDGDKVSTTAVSSILDTFTLSQGKGGLEQILLILAKQATEAVNRLLGPTGLRRSGSTLVMTLVRNNVFSFLSIGDSRICLYRSGILTQLNREHIYQNELMVKAINNELSLTNAYTDSRGSGLTSFLGMGIVKYIDMPASPLRLLPGDRIILMSDGVYNALSEEEITAALRYEPDQAAEHLKAAIKAKRYVNQDNYTAVILACTAETSASEDSEQSLPQASPSEEEAELSLVSIPEKPDESEEISESELSSEREALPQTEAPTDQ